MEDHRAQAERARVAALIERDSRDRQQDRFREEARQRVENGDGVSSQDTVLGPTPEWMGRNETRAYYPRIADNSAKAFKTVRRVQTSYVLQLHRIHQIDDAQFRACTWYREAHEIAGLAGQYAATRFSAEPGSGTGAFGHMPASHTAAVARQAFREARAAIGEPILFFDKVVLEDMRLRTASSFGRFAQRRAIQSFVAMAERLARHLDETSQV